MKRSLKASKAIKDMLENIKPDLYTKQTLMSLFRSLLETVISSRQENIVLVKINDIKGIEGPLQRLKFTNAKVFSYSQSLKQFGYKQIGNNIEFINDEFLIIFSDRFSAALCWNNNLEDLIEGFCTFNSSEIKKIINHLESVTGNKEVNEELNAIRLDRRHHEHFEQILNKLLFFFDHSQRDLISADSEIKALASDENYDNDISVDKIISTIAHELRNPLGMVNLYAKIIDKSVEKLESGELNEKITDSLKKASDCILNASENLEHLLEDLRNYSKPIILNKENISISEVVSQTVDLVQPAFDAKGVILNYLPPDIDYKAEFDRFKIHQVLLNLIKNALEATEAGGSVNVIVQKNKSGDGIQIRVKDTGCGIPEENLKKIFLPYFTTKQKGSGIGLAQSKKIVSAHKGSLVIDSTDINGTCITLQLPV